MILSHRRWSIFVSVFAIALCASLAPAQDADSGEWTQTEELWYTLELNDVKAGWMHASVYDNGHRYRTHTVTKMAIKRAAVPIEIIIESTFIETHEGVPILMRSIQDMSLQKVEQEWWFKDDHIEMISRQGDREITKKLPWPEDGWLTPMAVDRYINEQIEAGKSTIKYRMLISENGINPVRVTMKYKGDDLFTHDKMSYPVTVWESMTSVMPTPATERFNAEGNVVFSEIDSPLGKMTTKLASRETAMGEGDESLEAPELIFDTFVKPSSPIKDPLEVQTATLRVRPKKGEMPQLPSAGAQRVEDDPETDGVLLTIDINDNLPASGADEANLEYLESSAMVDADDTIIRKLAGRAVKRAGDDPYKKAEALRKFVNKHISRKGLATAFASASETARMRTGDCSEHGVLLAAMLRAEDIPARLALGLVYAESFAGENDIFGWHMWTQALIDGKWVDFDATLPVRYSAAHVLTGTSSLSQGLGAEDMSSMYLLMGNIEIDVVDVGYEVESPPKPKSGNRENRTDETPDKQPAAASSGG